MCTVAAYEGTVSVGTAVVVRVSVDSDLKCFKASSAWSTVMLKIGCVGF